MAQDPIHRKPTPDAKSSFPGTGGERLSVNGLPQHHRSRMRLSLMRFRLIAFSTVSGLTVIALIGGFITGDMQPFHTVLSFMIGVVSGIMTGRVDTN